MNFNPDFFEQNGVDFGGQISEEFLNRFSAAHHSMDNSIYHIVQHITNFGLNMDIKLDVNQPIVFDLSPIPEDKFKNIWKSHLIIKGASPQFDPPITPPNLKISVDGVKFTFIVYNEDGSVYLNVDFTWDVYGTCAVVLDHIEEETILRLEPIKIQFSEHEQKLLKELKQKMQAFIPLSNSKLTPKASSFLTGDDPEKLVLYLLNQILATQVSNFVQEFKLPKSFELMNGVTIEPGTLTISDHVLAVGCKVGQNASDIVENAKADIAIFYNAFWKEFDREFRNFNEEQLKQWKPESSSTLKWLNDWKHAFEKDIATYKATTTVNEYPENMMLFSNDALPDAVANQFFNFYEKQDYSTTLIPLVLKAKCGWAVKLSNAETTIMDHGLKLSMNASFHGYAGVGCPNPDPKHWGEWIWMNLGVTIWPDPEAGLIANPKFKDDGIYMGGELTTKSIKAKIDNIPSWANDAVGWITGFLTTPIFSIVNLIVSKFDFKIIDYPSQGFPGTAIVIKPENWRINQQPVKIGSYLVFSGDTHFI